ncbi:hypothetical protein HOK51_06865 [Candidatus Woesearchaeota archaeon]|jgi:hypothetical protein|nr:hypothetical protein [Candidatus Woesearchaeota archaeon]MBT6519544.1 hypothetical protein [Candidatus Woesearchaeota archaeon]MBT7367711.1 hypothetical protein [Candidatus Woesearchaeota archaeon]
MNETVKKYLCDLVEARKKDLEFGVLNAEYLIKDKSEFLEELKLYDLVKQELYD